MDAVTRINKKDSYLFKKFFEENFRAIVMFADKYVDNMELSTDVAQESFIQLWHSDIEFASQEKLKGFLYTTARNISLNHIKHARVISKWQEQQNKEEVEMADYIIEQETYKLVHLAINSLATQSKEIILLSLQGLTNQEIADKLGVSINTVRTLKQNAYRKLKGLLKEYFYVIAFLLKL